MGSTYHVHVGAYLEIRADEVPGPPERRCPNGHKAFHSGDYCPACGERVESVPTTVPARLHDLVDGEELYQLGGDNPTPKGVILAAGNRSDSEAGRDYDNVAFVQQIDFAYVVNAITAFKLTYAKTVAEIRAHPAVRSMTVRFGVVGFRW